MTIQIYNRLYINCHFYNYNCTHIFVFPADSKKNFSEFQESLEIPKLRSYGFTGRQALAFWLNFLNIQTYMLFMLRLYLDILNYTDILEVIWPITELTNNQLQLNDSTNTPLKTQPAIQATASSTTTSLKENTFQKSFFHFRKRLQSDEVLSD